MNARVKVLKELVRDGQYVVDPAAVAEAIVARSLARRVLPDVSFRSTPAAPSDPTAARRRSAEP